MNFKYFAACAALVVIAAFSVRADESGDNAEENKLEQAAEADSSTSSVIESNSTNCDQVEIRRLRMDISSYIDAVLDNLRETLVKSGFKEVKLPDAKVSHTTPFLGVQWHAVAAVENGTLRGVETLHRNGAAHINFTDSDLHFSADVGFKTLNTSYLLRAQFMGLGPQATIRGSMDGVTCFLKAKATRNAPVTVGLEDLKVSNIGRVSLDIDGAGAFWDNVSESMRDNLAKIFTLVVRNLVENSIKDMLNGIMSSKMLPSDPSCYFLF